MPVAREHLRCNLGEGGHFLAGTLHDLHTINSEKKIEGGFGPLVRQCVEQGLEVVQAAFVEHDSPYGPTPPAPEPAREEQLR